MYIHIYICSSLPQVGFAPINAQSAAASAPQYQEALLEEDLVCLPVLLYGEMISRIDMK